MAEFDVTVAHRFLIALLIGALVGIEREKHKRNEHPREFGGLRTFALFSLLGAISAWLSLQLDTPWLFIFAAIGAIAIIITAYILENRRKAVELGLTSELAAIMVFLLGGAVMYGQTALAVSLGILTSAILTFKNNLHALVNKIGNDDLYAGLKLLIATFIVLPFLPREAIDPWQALNPYKLWLLVVLISSMSLVGYIAVRWLGPSRGTAITGLFGGLASSTAVSLSFARNSKTDTTAQACDTLAAGILLAWLVMFVRVIIMVAILHLPLLSAIIQPFILMSVTTAVLAIIFYRRGSQNPLPKEKKELNVTNPFSLVSAMQFGLLFAVVLLLVKLTQHYAPEQGMYFLAAIAGLTDVDAITLSLLEFARNGNNFRLAVTAIIIASLSNTIMKCALVLIFGSKALATRLTISTFAIIVIGLLGAVYLS